MRGQSDGGYGMRWTQHVLRVFSPPSRWRAFLMDLGIVLVFVGTHTLTSALAPDPGRADWWPLLVSIPATFLLLLRRQFPWTVLVLLLASTMALVHFEAEIGVLNLVILVAVYSVCVQTSKTGAVIASVLAMAYPATELEFMGWGEGVVRMVAAVVNLVMIVGWGRAMKIGRQRAVQLEQTIALLDEARDQMATDAAVVERARIAREFHDIVSHNLSVVALRAGVARALLDQDPDHARRTLHELEQTSRSALDEMRHMLSALREDPATEQATPPGEQEEAARQPAPRLDRVDALLETVRGTGVVWRLDRRGAVRQLGTGLEMTAYRVVQEAVTNILKHAGAGYARVLLDYGAAALRVEVTNHTANVAATQQSSAPVAAAVRERAALPPSGHGLIGLRERVALLGGTLAAHPVPGGFHLAAVLPFRKISDLA